MRKIIFALCGLALAAAPSAALAHHSFAPFDGTKSRKIVGTVKDFQWTNPHIWIQVLAPDDSGKVVEWSVEAPAINGLKRVGWTAKSLRKGDKVTVCVHPLRSGGPGGALADLWLADGKRMPRTAIQGMRDTSVCD